MRSVSPRLVSSLLFGVCWCFLGPASAHDKWLEVQPFVASTPTATKLYLLTGDALRQPELLPLRQKSRTSRFQLVTTAAKRDLLPLLQEDVQPIASLPADTLPQGTSIVQLDTAPIDILLTAEKFQAYLFEEQLIDILMERANRREEDVPGRERYSRSIKALVQIGKRTDDLASKPLGQDLEIVPLANPYSLARGSRLAVQVLLRGQPLPGRAVTFANRYHNNVVTKSIRTDERGQVALPLERSGEWLISLVLFESLLLILGDALLPVAQEGIARRCSGRKVETKVDPVQVRVGRRIPALFAWLDSTKS